MRSIEHAFDPMTGGRTAVNEMTTAGGPAPVRLTRRGRAVVVLTVMLLAVLAGFTIGRGSSLAAGAGRAPERHVIVEPGETLWSVAARVAPTRDPRAVVADLETLNHLSSPTVEPGERLAVPTGG
jgi:hypothetical protein